MPTPSSSYALRHTLTRLVRVPDSPATVVNEQQVHEACQYLVFLYYQSC
jgi:hypothetical protein